MKGEEGASSKDKGNKGYFKVHWKVYVYKYKPYVL